MHIQGVYTCIYAHIYALCKLRPQKRAKNCKRSVKFMIKTCDVDKKSGCRAGWRRKNGRGWEVCRDGQFHNKKVKEEEEQAKTPEADVCQAQEWAAPGCTQLGLAGSGLAWSGLAWPGLVWSGLVWVGPGLCLTSGSRKCTPRSDNLPFRASTTGAGGVASCCSLG